ncbi:preprotein translocase subunit SecE [Chamaesiphon sp. VAR_69_metabat_338]|uniref:preprotein translocase subunit SecE n=1 Tax=Chamaesiphon sp. VAR_69_metabat_338 TaxID=2964704 RepID=UPI00286DA677|nr:preprotein translocase subunit SecE [Chamaesiphon sp. VAR_69_metabat_338]
MVKKTESPPTEPVIAEPQSGFNPVQLVRDSQAELTKVIWPSRQQLISESLAVIAMVSLSATTIYLVNNLFSWVAAKVFV